METRQETFVPLDPASILPGDAVGIGVHTANALRGYEIGRAARERGAYVVFGGIHATLILRGRGGENVEPAGSNDCSSERHILGFTR
jgi:hypothetical protein